MAIYRQTLETGSDALKLAAIQKMALLPPALHDEAFMLAWRDPSATVRDAAVGVVLEEKSGLAALTEKASAFYFSDFSRRQGYTVEALRILN